MSENRTLRSRAMQGLFWSLLQNIVGRLMSVLLFILLARFVTPDEFGFASTAIVVVSFLAVIADFGMGDALVQRPQLRPGDPDLALYASLAGSVILAGLLIVAAVPVARIMKAEALAPYLQYAALFCPILVAISFQEALYRRAELFRALALRTVFGIFASGVVGLTLALNRWGAWALLGQFSTQVVISALWLWSRSTWRPSRALDPAVLHQLLRFGVSLVLLRAIDFVAMRSIDFVILGRHGATALGLFAVSMRIDQTLTQLVQVSVSAVALSFLSRIASDPQRLARSFLRTVSLCATFGTPAFLGVAALSPDLVRIALGGQWIGADEIVRPLLIVGGVQCIQFICGSYLIAMGRPGTLLGLIVVKTLIVIFGILIVKNQNLQETVITYSLLLLCEAPITFGVMVYSLSIKWSDLATAIIAPCGASILSFVVSEVVRGEFTAQLPPNLLMVLIFAIFVTVFFGILISCALGQFKDNVGFVLSGLRRQ